MKVYPEYLAHHLADVNQFEYVLVILYRSAQGEVGWYFIRLNVLGQ